MRKSLYFSLFLSIYSNAAFAKCVFDKPVQVLETSVGNVLSWNTASETENNHFTIEKSLDGKNFTVIGEVKGAGTSKEIKKYRFLDLSTGETKAFYRIANVDNAAKTGYTPTFICNRKSANNFNITAMSSLRTDSYLSVSLRSAVENSMTYKVTNLQGKVLVSNVLSVIDGANILTIDSSDLPNGEYVLQLIMKNEVEDVIFTKVDKKDMVKIDYVVKE
jgi:hypothetical protein